ncbi:MAG: hypothetical protein J2P54_25465 [Bradyrhizobiaceae bacterium]|nr:hypothetical protein [Bradyrhizobiaceae bacterium]
MIPKSAECLERAAKAEEAAHHAGNRDAQEALQRIADSWRRLAVSYEFIGDTDRRPSVYEERE